jgi:GH24 family phage-related lysozyme (muramidase)
MADSFVEAVNNKATGGNAIVPEAMDLLKTFESFKPTSYYDLDNKKKRGTLTVGYGFTKNDIPEIREGYSMDKATAERLLPTLVKTKYGATVREKVKVPLNDQQYSALSSFAYNVGPTNFSSSTLVKKLNAGDYEGAASEFKKWNKAGGKELEGLSRRRAAEAALFKGDTMELGKILEKQKFGNAEPKKKGDMTDAGDSFMNAMSQADLAKAVSAPIGEGGSPDNPPEYSKPDNFRLMLPSDPPKFKDLTTGEITSEALTPLPDSPEEAGTKAAEQVAKDLETPKAKKEKPAEDSPEAVGKVAAEKIAKDVGAKKENEEIPALVRWNRAHFYPDDRPLEKSTDESNDKNKKEEKPKETPMGGIYFNSPTLGAVVSGLKRGAGLGRMK